MIWFLHGNLGTPQDGKPLVAALTAAGYKVQSPSLWNLMENGGETLETAGERLAELILKTDPEPIICAYSLGARIVLHALPHLVPHCRALILIGVHPGLDDEEERSRRRKSDEQLARRLRNSSWENFLRDWNSQPVFCHSKNIARVKPPAKTLELMARAFESWSLGSQKNQTPILSEIIRHYALPTLLVSGENDKKFRDIAATLVAELPGASHRVVLSAGHRIPEDMPEELAAILCDFLKHSLPLRHAMNNPFPDTNDPEALRALIAAIAEYYMPFGMFGPAHYPPKGVILYDLPVEYLGWFKQNGFPKGKLGDYLEVLWELKSNGLDALFDPFRKARGGRMLGKKKKQSTKFDIE